ncbi:hypothetical protein [Actinoplanes sp. NPDC051851]|uniref:hypothetical protein n=1 Tax=Actinoplanes sp. NPDC051851 TaxID=3154753 RepID=UPI0034329C35
MNSALRTAVGGFNRIVVKLQVLPWMRRRMTVVTYVGRRSGREFSTPVAYFRTDSGVRIDVMMPDAKNWWRNFTGAGGPLTVRLDGADRTGHAVAERSGKRRVTVSVHLAE